MRSDLTTIRPLVIEDATPRPYSCVVCGATFRTVQGVAAHASGTGHGFTPAEPSDSC